MKAGRATRLACSVVRLSFFQRRASGNEVACPHFSAKEETLTIRYLWCAIFSQSYLFLVDRICHFSEQSRIQLLSWADGFNRCGSADAAVVHNGTFGTRRRFGDSLSAWR